MITQYCFCSKRHCALSASQQWKCSLLSYNLLLCSVRNKTLPFSVKRIHILKHFKSGIFKYNHFNCSQFCRMFWEKKLSEEEPLNVL